MWKIPVITGLVLFFLSHDIQGGTSCKNPQGKDGDIFTEECLIKKCKGGIWRTSLDSSVCCYEGKAYHPNTIVSTTMSEDQCGKATVECKEDMGDARLELSVKNFCAIATKEQVAEIKDLLEKTSEKKCDTESVEAKINQPVRDLLLVDSTGQNTTRVLQLPYLTPLPGCSVPPPVLEVVYPVVGTVGGNHVVCGGREIYSMLHTNECNVLKDGKWTSMPSMSTPRGLAAASMTSKGWLVSGGVLEYQLLNTTELFSNNEWSAGPVLPHVMQGHCQVTVGSHVYIFGGTSYKFFEEGYSDYINLPTAYKLENDEWKPLPNMTVAPESSWIDCVALDNSIYVRGGWPETNIQRLDLSTLTWSIQTGLPTTNGGLVAVYESSIYFRALNGVLRVDINTADQEFITQYEEHFIEIENDVFGVSAEEIGC